MSKNRSSSVLSRGVRDTADNQTATARVKIFPETYLAIHDLLSLTLDIAMVL